MKTNWVVIYWDTNIDLQKKIYIESYEMALIKQASLLRRGFTRVEIVHKSLLGGK
jgi:hypothetical protein